FGSYAYSCPVVEDGVPVGVVWPMDVIERYNAELFKREMASSMALAVSNGVRVQTLPGVHGVNLAEVAVPSSFVGKTMSELNLRSEFNLTVLLIRRRVEGSDEVVTKVPDGGSALESGDLLLVLGGEGGIRRLEQTA
ncbi:MAG: TrkA C-terminal domain-containing protein, partial [Pirellulales bacterium]